KFIIISGWRKVLACQELGIEKIPAFLWNERDDLKILLFKIHEYLTMKKELNFLEKAQIISKLYHFGMEKREIIQNYLPLLKISPSNYDFETYLSLSELSPSIKRAILKGNITFQGARALTKFSLSEQEFLLPIIIPMSSNYQKEFLINVYEILKKEGITLDELFSRRDLKEIIESRNFSQLEKIEKIIDKVRSIRYPSYTAFKKFFELWVKEIKFPKGVNILHDQFFEEEKLSLKIKFKNDKELRDILEKLEKICNSEKFKEYFKRKDEI
ncbi:hypothetical protein NLB65_01810, partial [Candidatus Aminicenantes bacterium AC-335-B20]|nr:hypothetical protein [Candidatus Aminicenantes bacterium AC-335-B20]